MNADRKAKGAGAETFAAWGKRYLFSAKGAVSLEPGASPQEFKSPCKQPRKLSGASIGEWIEWVLEVKIALSALALFAVPSILGRCPRVAVNMPRLWR